VKHSESRTISASFVQAVFKKAALTPEQRDSMLLQANIPVATLDTDRGRVSASQFAHILGLLIDHTGDHSIGYFRHPAKESLLDTMARYCRDADNLLQAIQRNIEFFNLFDTGFHLSLHERDRYVFYRMEADQQEFLETWLCEQHLMLCHRYFCWLTGTPLPLLRVNMKYAAPPHKDEYHYLFRCETRFLQPHYEMIFDRQLLRLPVVRSRTELEDYLTRVPYEFLQMPSQESSYSEQIRRYLKRSLPTTPSYEQIASSIGLTPQTLRRRLAQEGCDFRQIKNEFLRDTAIALLNADDSDIKSISYQLGFSEPSAFIRSFKSWTGTTPNLYRQSKL
jgi:AraC-like DNA-binding protein